MTSSVSERRHAEKKTELGMKVLADDATLRGEHLGRVFGRGAHRVVALNGVDAEVRPGECLALIGGSGSGKSTLSRILLGLDMPTSGVVTYQGLPVQGRKSSGYRELRRVSSLVFQNPFASLDPRWTVGMSVAEPLRLHGGTSDRDAMEQRVCQALTTVGLEPTAFMNRYAMDLSGGQAQRVAIARAIVSEPRIIVADEPMSAIDVTSRMRILKVFAHIRDVHPQTALLIVSHDLGVVQHIADRIIVLHDGMVEEAGATCELLSHPRSEYTKALIAAAS